MLFQAEMSPAVKKSDKNRLDATPEMGQKKVKCFKCSQWGHIAVNCPMLKREPVTLVVTTEPDKEATDPWVLQLTTDGEESPNSTTLSLRGPAYKAVVQAEGICT